MLFFGPVRRPDYGPESGVGVLVEFKPGHTSGLLFLPSRKSYRSCWADRLISIPPFLSFYFRGQVIAEAEVQYEQARPPDSSSTNAQPRPSGC